MNHSSMDRPTVTLKLATSLDGRIATADGQSKWITGEAARAEVHRMRARVDAVMIGAGTARADNPSLLARTDPPPSRQPKRVVLSRSFDVPISGRLFEALDASPLIVIGEDPSERSSALEAAGARVGFVIDMASDSPALALSFLRENLDARSLLVEGGGVLAAGLIKANVVDRIEWFRAPILLGAEGRPAIGGLALTGLADAPRWRRVAVRELGPDLWESYERG